LIEDTSLCFKEYKGLPGPYIKDFLTKLGPEKLAKMGKCFEDNSAYAQTIFSYKFNKD